MSAGTHQTSTGGPAANIETVIAVVQYVQDNGADPFRRSDLEPYGIDGVPDSTVQRALHRLDQQGYLQHEDGAHYWIPAPMIVDALSHV